MKRIAIVGAGHVGLVTGTCLAELGNTVVCLDTDAGTIDALRAGRAPFYEPRLLETIDRNRAAGRLTFSTDIAAGVQENEMVFIAVGTSTDAAGNADVSAVCAVAATIGKALNGAKIVVLKSTVPVETAERISAIVAANAVTDYRVDVISNPEFLREGSAIDDFMRPDRIVVGVSSPEAEEAMRDLYRSLDVPIVVTDLRTSEMIKYAANAFLALKISYMNEIANICDLVDVDVTAVAYGMSFDRRIGARAMSPGIGYGGSCFAKDIGVLQKMASERNYEAALLRAVDSVNRTQSDRTFDKVMSALDGDATGKTVGVLGLSFKPDTDDMRQAPSLRVIAKLLAANASIRVHDPVALDAARAELGDRVAYCDTMYEASRDVDVLLLATEWDEYANIDFSRVRTFMRGSTVIDGRNAFDPATVAEAGFDYIGIGRRRRAADS